MNPLVIKGAGVVSVVKGKAPLVKKAGGKVISLLLTTGTGMEVVNKVIDNRERTRIIKDFDEKYNKATSYEEKEMIMKYRMEYIYNIPGLVNQMNQCPQGVC